MAYAETTDLSLSNQRLIELTDSEENPGEGDADVLDVTRGEAEAIVNGVLASSRPVPFADDAVPPLITVLTAWIWAYRLYRHREVMEIPKSIVDDYNRALTMLQQIVDGEILIDPVNDDKLGGVPRVTSSCPRTWTHRGRFRA